MASATTPQHPSSASPWRGLGEPTHTSGAEHGLSRPYGPLALSLDGSFSQTPYDRLPESPTHKQSSAQTGRGSKR